MKEVVEHTQHVEESELSKLGKGVFKRLMSMSGHAEYANDLLESRAVPPEGRSVENELKEIKFFFMYLHSDLVHLIANLEERAKEINKMQAADIKELGAFLKKLKRKIDVVLDDEPLEHILTFANRSLPLGGDCKRAKDSLFQLREDVKVYLSWEEFS